MTRDELERYLLQGFTEEITVMVETSPGVLKHANICYEIGKHTNHEGVLVLFPSELREEGR